MLKLTYNKKHTIVKFASRNIAITCSKYLNSKYFQISLKRDI